MAADLSVKEAKADRAAFLLIGISSLLRAALSADIELPSRAAEAASDVLGSLGTADAFAKIVCLGVAADLPIEQVLAIRTTDPLVCVSLVLMAATSVDVNVVGWTAEVVPDVTRSFRTTDPVAEHLSGGITADASFEQFLA